MTEYLLTEYRDGVLVAQGASGTTIDVADMGAGPLVRGDRDQLSQALGNLIENALK